MREKDLLEMIINLETTILQLSKLLIPKPFVHGQQFVRNFQFLVKISKI